MLMHALIILAYVTLMCWTAPTPSRLCQRRTTTATKIWVAAHATVLTCLLVLIILELL